MKPTPWTHLDPFRIRSGQWASPLGVDYGAFVMIIHRPMVIMASPGGPGVDWEHVSVSCKNRAPNWLEMSEVKDLFWSEEETVIQFHPPRSVYVNVHPFCLHLWRPRSFPILLPPSWTLGNRADQSLDEMNAEIEQAIVVKA